MGQIPHNLQQIERIKMTRLLSICLSVLLLMCLSYGPNVFVLSAEVDGETSESSPGIISNVLEGALQGDIYLIEKGLKQGKESIDVTNGTCTKSA
jgi:hypothetical protein